MPATIALNLILSVDAGGGYAAEALDAGRSQRGLQASVRATDGRDRIARNLESAEAVLSALDGDGGEVAPA